MSHVHFLQGQCSQSLAFCPFPSMPFALCLLFVLKKIQARVWGRGSMSKSTCCTNLAPVSCEQQGMALRVPAWGRQRPAEARSCQHSSSFSERCCLKGIKKTVIEDTGHLPLAPRRVYVCVHRLSPHRIPSRNPEPLRCDNPSQDLVASHVEPAFPVYTDLSLHIFIYLPAWELFQEACLHLVPLYSMPGLSIWGLSG